MHIALWDLGPFPINGMAIDPAGNGNTYYCMVMKLLL